MAKTRLSPLELEILDNIWGFEKQCTVRDVLQKAYPKGEKAYTTVQTVMNNLFDKGYLKREKIGMVNFYQPRQHKSKVLQKEVSRFLDKTFSGSFNSMVSFLFEADALSREEIDELKKLINEREQENE